MEFTVQSNFTGTTPEFKSTIREWLREAAQVVRLDIRQHILDSQSIDGSGPLPALEQSTINAKAGLRNMGRHITEKFDYFPSKKSGKEMRGSVRYQSDVGSRTSYGIIKKGNKFTSGSPDKPLIDTGNLLNNQTIKVGAGYAEIGVGPTRSKIAGYLQIDGVGKKKKTFNFFGISPEAGENIITALKARIFREVDKI